jgi:osmotically-inducible protein OsmY
VKSALALVVIGLALLGPMACRTAAGPAPETKAEAPPREQADGVTRASRAAEKKLEEALKGRSMTRTAADAAITGRIKTALLGDPTVTASDINVDTLKGVVYLKGTVGSKAEAQKAVAIAGKTFGVKAVKSQLKVVPSGKPAGTPQKSKAAASGGKPR